MRYGDLRWVDIDSLSKENVVVICPIASLEQHGHHLPLLTDTYLVTGVADGVHEKLGDKVVMTPTLWLGASDHHLDFPGTVSVPNTVYTEMIKNMARSFIQAGFRRIVFLNGHGGNVIPGTQALTEMTNSLDSADECLMALSSYWTIADPVLEASRHGMQTDRLTHACEYETSMMLHLQKHLVAVSSAKGSEPVIQSAFFNDQGGGRVNVPHRFHRRSETGAMGRPDVATAEKGASLLAAIVDEVAAFVEDFSEWPHFRVLKPARPLS